MGKWRCVNEGGERERERRVLRGVKEMLNHNEERGRGGIYKK